MDAVIAVLPVVFLVTLVGYFAVLMGGGLWRLQLGMGARNAANRVLDIVPQCSMMLMSSRNVLVFQSLLCLLLHFLILAFYFLRSGFAFDLEVHLREPGTPSGSFAHFELLGHYCLPLPGAICGQERKNPLACTVLLTLGLAFFGARGNVLTNFIQRLALLCSQTSPPN